jgi:hypothetical protein
VSATVLLHVWQVIASYDQRYYRLTYRCSAGPANTPSVLAPAGTVARPVKAAERKNPSKGFSQVVAEEGAYESPDGYNHFDGPPVPVSASYRITLIRSRCFRPALSINFIGTSSARVTNACISRISSILPN